MGELLKSTPLQEHLIRAAWSSLAVESKLEIIESIQQLNEDEETPTWLLNLAMDDDAMIVRLWAARKGYFDHNPKWHKEIYGDDIPDEIQNAKEKVLVDPESMIQDCAFRGSRLLGYRPLTALQQSSRLMLIRYQEDQAIHENFFIWLTRAASKGVSDTELAECAEEYFARPTIKWMLAGSVVLDSAIARSLGEAVNSGWTIVSEVGGALANVLIENLPVHIEGIFTLTLENMLEMDEWVLSAVVARSRLVKSPEIDKLIEAIAEDPMDFPESVILEYEQIYGSPF